MKLRKSLIKGFDIGVATAASGVPVLANANAELFGTHGIALDWSMKGNVGRNDADSLEEVFAVEYKVLKRSWLGKNIKLQSKVPDFRGGSTYANDDDESDDDEPNAQMASLDVVGVVDEDFFSGATFAGQRPRITQNWKVVIMAAANGTNGHRKADIETDVLVIGGGFGGMYSIYKFRKSGLSVKLIEAGSDFSGSM
ncbi:hypothetical protein ACEPPN_015074 [Leptodophora sp. 'Broadleaf-Isolate-01']